MLDFQNVINYILFFTKTKFGTLYLFIFWDCFSFINLIFLMLYMVKGFGFDRIYGF